MRGPELLDDTVQFQTYLAVGVALIVMVIIAVVNFLSRLCGPYQRMHTRHMAFAKEFDNHEMKQLHQRKPLCRMWPPCCRRYATAASSMHSVDSAPEDATGHKHDPHCIPGAHPRTFAVYQC
jgi:hypothetical protein